MIVFSKIDEGSESSAFRWHSDFAEKAQSVYPRKREEFRAFVEQGTAWCARDERGYVGLAYATPSADAWEIGGLAVTVEARDKGIGHLLAYVTLGHLLFEEDPLDDDPPRPIPIIVHVLKSNDKPRSIVENLLRFRRSQSVKIDGDTLPGLVRERDGYVHGDEYVISLPGTLLSLATWAASWEGKLRTGESARIELREGTTLSDWAAVFQSMAARHHPIKIGGRKVTDYRPTGLAKLHALIYSLLFPGLLAAFILTQFTEEPLVEGMAHWSWLLCVYFAVQFVEGHEAKANYTLDRAAVNLLEMLVMVLIFAALGYFPDLKVGETLRSPFAISVMMFTVFALPAAHRLLFQPATLKPGYPSYLFVWSLTAMSLLAAFLGAFFPMAMWAWATVLAMLLLYTVVFQFCNEWLVDQLLSEKRRWVAAFRRP